MNSTRVAAALTGLALAAGTAACTGEGGTTTAASPPPTTTLTLAFSHSEDHPQFAALASWGEQVQAATEGRVTVDVRADGALGSTSGVLEGVADGSIDLAVVPGTDLEPFNEDFGLFDLPYLFSSPDAQAATLSDPSVTGDLFASLEESRSTRVLAGLYGGTRNIYTTTGPVTTPGDLDGLTIRVDSSQVAVKMIEDMGGAAAPLALDEVSEGLANGLIDGAENTVDAYVGYGHDQTASHYSYTRHLMVPDYLVMNTDRLDGLARGDQQALVDLLPDLVQQSNAAVLAGEDSARAAAEDAGATFTDGVDIEAFSARTQPLVQDFLTNPVRTSLHDVVQKANEEHP